MKKFCIAAFILAVTITLSGCVEWFYFYSPNQVSYLTSGGKEQPQEDVVFFSSDGTQLHGWFIPARGERRGTIVYFHGNTKNISGHLRYVEWLPAEGYDVFLFDYRGYGLSSGTPDPQGVHDDCVAALAYVRSRPDVDLNNIVIFGQSLGGSYALGALASSPQAGIRAVIIEGAFASHREIARDKIASYPLPETLRTWIVEHLIGDRYDAIDALRRVEALPILLIHGTDDEIVPYRHAELLRAAAHGKLTFWSILGGHHLDTFVHQPEQRRRQLLEYLDNLKPPVSGL